MPSSKQRLAVSEYYLKMLALVSARGTCPRRSVGAIITDSDNKILSTGYNGVPSGVEHCIDSPCPGTADRPGSTDRCLAVHAEANALIQCGDIHRAAVLYVTCTPCFTCAKLICNTPIKKVIVLEAYADARGEALFKQLGVEIIIYHHV